MLKFKRNLSLFIREKVLQHYLIPYSRYGVPSAILKFLPNSKPISLVDVGASRGEFSKSLCSRYELKKALLIEPQPELYDKLSKTFKEPVFTLKNCAIGEEERFQEMKALKWDYSSSLLEVRRDISVVNNLLDLDEKYRFTCQVRKLDNVISEINWSSTIDLLKIDVQGAELLVLKGAEETLKRTNLIYTEVSYRNLYLDSAIFHHIYEYLSGKGFKLLTISDGFRGSDGELLQSDALFCNEFYLSSLPDFGLSKGKFLNP